jgi:large subunit ribosomal protein L19
MINKFVASIEESSKKGADSFPIVTVGDTVDVHTKIVEGEKERVQVFSGTVISKTGRGTTEMITVRRIVMNEGVERIFPLHSPNVVKIVVKRGGETRRAKLTYLRNRVGKATRLADTVKKEAKTEAAAE